MLVLLIIGRIIMLARLGVTSNESDHADSLASFAIFIDILLAHLGKPNSRTFRLWPDL